MAIRFSGNRPKKLAGAFAAFALLPEHRMPRRPTLHACAPRRRSGLALIELALALPVLLVVVAGIVQFGGLFFLRNEMINLARDAARRLAVNEMTSAQVKPFVANGFGSWPATFSVLVQLPNPAVPADKDVSVTITVPMSEASTMDIFGMFQQGDLTAAVTMRQE